jgi:hypothetical protein
MGKTWKEDKFGKWKKNRDFQKKHGKNKGNNPKEQDDRKQFPRPEDF